MLSINNGVLRVHGMQLQLQKKLFNTFQGSTLGDERTLVLEYCGGNNGYKHQFDNGPDLLHQGVQRKKETPDLKNTNQRPENFFTNQAGYLTYCNYRTNDLKTRPKV